MYKRQTDDSGESGQVLTLAQLPANDSVQLHFKAKLNSKAATAKGLENTVKVTASKLSANTTLEALKSDKTMEDSDKISVESSDSLRIAKSVSYTHLDVYKRQTLSTNSTCLT